MRWGCDSSAEVSGPFPHQPGSGALAHHVPSFPVTAVHKPLFQATAILYLASFQGDDISPNY